MPKLEKLTAWVVIVCSVAILGLSFVLMADRNKQRADAKETHEKLDATTAELHTTQKNLADTKKKLADTETDLKNTRQTLEETSQKLAAETKRADQLDTDLKDLQKKFEEQAGQLKAATEQLATAQKTIEDLTEKRNQLSTEVAGLKELKHSLEEQVKGQDAELRRLKGIEVPLPPGLSGRVLAVDRTWNFVVIDIGRQDGVLPGGNLVVGRGEKSVGKVKVVQALADKSIADIIKLNDPKMPLQVGDGVLTER